MEICLRSCNDRPKYKIPSVQSDERFRSPRIKLHIYEVITIYYKHDVVEYDNLIRNISSNSVYYAKQKELVWLEERC